MIKKIVTIGGGKGQSELLAGLRNFPYELGAVVSMTDNGGSSGEMRKQFNILPPGDMRRCIAELSRNRALADEWNSRDSHGTAVGNEVLRKLFMEYGVEEGARQAHILFDVEGTVVPVTTANVQLTARLSDGSMIEGEDKIDHLAQFSQERITQLGVTSSADISESARTLIAQADMIVLSMGSLFASLLSNFAIAGVADAIRAAAVPVVFICNRSNGEDSIGFSQTDYIAVVQQYLGEGVLTHVIADDSTLSYPPHADRVTPGIMDDTLTVLLADIADPDRPEAVSGHKAAAVVHDLCISL